MALSAAPPSSFRRSRDARIISADLSIAATCCVRAAHFRDTGHSLGCYETTRGSLARATTDRFRHSSLSTVKTHRASTNACSDQMRM
jgi:hypothetical protein